MINVTEVPVKTKSCRENFRYVKADAVKVPRIPAMTASQVFKTVAYKTALSVMVLLNTLIPLSMGNETHKKQNPISAKAMILY